MSEPRRLRVRGYVPPGPAKDPRPPWTPRSYELALLLHVDADERDQLTAATHQELLTTAGTTAPIAERLYAPEHLLPALQRDAAALHPRTLPGPVSYTHLTLPTILRV